jgi:DNA-binding LytR/AlgR family response regulator
MIPELNTRKISPLYIRKTEKVVPLQTSVLQKIQDQGKICLPIPTGFMFCVPSDIRYMRAHSNYTEIYFSNGEKKLLSRTMKDLESLLPSALFVRSHKSYVVNIGYIATYSKDMMCHHFTLDTGEVIPVSRNFSRSI